jgi:S1-C subfamily serine protease
MTGLHRSLVFTIVTAGALWLAGCDTRQPILFTPNTEVGPAEQTASGALKYPRGPEGLAESNPSGFYLLRDGTSTKLIERNPLTDSTRFGEKAITLMEANAARLSAFPTWSRASADGLYAYSVRLFGKRGHEAYRYRILRSLAGDSSKPKGSGPGPHAEAQACLAMCYAQGIGIKACFYEALGWSWKSAATGSTRGAMYAYDLVKNSKGADETRSQLMYKYLLQAAEAGNVRAQAELGHWIASSKSSTPAAAQQSLERGRDMLLKAASTPLSDKPSLDEQRGKALALFYLGLLLDKGKGAPKNEPEALAHYYLAKSTYEFGSDFDYVDRNIKIREEHMSESARLYAQMRAQELRQIYFPSPAVAENQPEEGRMFGSGSGVFVTREGHLLTAAHVVVGARSVMAKLGDKTLNAEILAVDEPNDVALLKVDAKVDAAPVRASAGVELGNQVFTIGFPNMLLQGAEPKFTEGTISSTSGMRDDPRQFQVSVQVQPGNSGGALFDDNGNVVGLVVARLDDEATSQLTGSLPQNVNYAVKSSYALPLLESLRAELMNEHRRPWFGGNRDQVVSRAKRSSVPLIVELKPPRQ